MNNWRGAANGGANVVIVGTGNVNHEELCAAASDLADEVINIYCFMFSHCNV